MNRSTRYVLGVIVSLLLAATATADNQWVFNAETGEGGAHKAAVSNALGMQVLTADEARALRFTCVDTVDGCRRERPVRTWVRTSGNGEKVTGFWFVGYESQDSTCGSLAGAGPDAKLHVNGLPID